MRAAAHANLGPGQILTVLDAQVQELVHVGTDPHEPMPPKFATAAYAIVEPADGGHLRIANAGHPPLLVRYPTGEVVQAAAPPGAPLGLGLGDYAEITVPFPPGSMLLAYTDGLAESRALPLDTGIAQLAEDLAAFDQDDDLDGLADTLLAHADSIDDTALVLLRWSLRR
jgi:serine phosphatase RsbU (regulator of sigma subunit)